MSKDLSRMMNVTTLAITALSAISAYASSPSPVSSALLEGSSPNAWTMPKWGFLDARENSTPTQPKLTKSLIFDQSFDATKLRPLPEIQAPATSVAIQPVVKTPAPAPAVTAAAQTPAPAKPVAPIAENKVAKAVETATEAPAPKPAAKVAVASTRVKTAAASARLAPFAVHTRTSSEAARFISTLNKPKANAARVLVVDEESLTLADPHPVAGAEVHWVSAASGFSRRTAADGTVTAPYPNTISTRFVVTAPGYLPAVGYAVTGQTSAVALIKESRIGPVLKSLGVAPDPDRTLVIGKILRSNLSPASGITLDASVQAPFRVFYSIGTFGLFHPAARETGSQGDFLVSGFGKGLQYLMPSETSREWPATIIDTSELPAFSTATIVDSKPTKIETHVVDAMSLERPASSINLTIGGQRGLYLPDDAGSLSINELYARGGADLLEVRAQGYMKTWLTAVASQKAFPQLVSLFTQSEVADMLRPVSNMVDTTKGLVFGNLGLERYEDPVSILVFNSAGKRDRNASVFYFDANNRIAPMQKSTDPESQNFAVSNLEAGEWHLVVVNAKTGKGLSMQVVRVEKGTISQVQF